MVQTKTEKERAEVVKLLDRLNSFDKRFGLVERTSEIALVDFKDQVEVTAPTLKAMRGLLQGHLDTLC